MRRHHLIVGAIVVVLVGALLGVYQFYFKEKLQAYSQDLEKKERLVARLETLSSTFSNTQPEVIVGIWEGALMPWRDAVRDRAEYFTIEEQLTAEDIPEEGILKFYYEEQLNQRLAELRQEAFNQQIPIPATTFGSPTVESLRNSAPSRAQVLFWLRQVERGCDTTRMLLDAQPIRIDRIELWPAYEYRKVLQAYTVGVEWWITLENLLEFIQDVTHDEDRFCTVNELRIRNRRLRNYQDPPLEVSLILTQAEYREPDEKDQKALASLAAATTVGGVSAQEQFALLRSRDRDEEEPRRKGRSWFRKYFWPFDWP